jgi:hypothetical protein
VGRPGLRRRKKPDPKEQGQKRGHEQAPGQPERDAQKQFSEEQTDVMERAHSFLRYNNPRILSAGSGGVMRLTVISNKPEVKKAQMEK